MGRRVRHGVGHGRTSGVTPRVSYRSRIALPPSASPSLCCRRESQVVVRAPIKMPSLKIPSPRCSPRASPDVILTGGIADGYPKLREELVARLRLEAVGAEHRAKDVDLQVLEHEG